MVNEIDQQIELAESLMDQGKPKSALNILARTLSDAQKLLTANRSLVRDVKQANTLLAQIASRAARAAHACRKQTECSRYCDFALGIFERYGFAGDTTVHNQCYMLYALLDDPKEFVKYAIFDRNAEHPVTSAFAEMDEANSRFATNDFKTAYSHLLKAKELLWDEVMVKQHVMHRGSLVECYTKMLEIQSCSGDAESAVESCSAIMQWLAELMQSGRLQYARYYYLSWYYRFFAKAKAGLKQQALDDSVALRESMRAEIDSFQRDDLIPLQTQINQKIDAIVKLM
jgi:hypothetical protein